MKKIFIFLFSAVAVLIAGTLLATARFFDDGANKTKEDKINVGQNIRQGQGQESGGFFAVARVIDGDTFEANVNGAVEKVRVIGIDTPEIVDPRKPVECFGVEASNRAEVILSGQKVRLEYDPAQGERDKYARLLRHVFLEDGTNFGLLMIREGYAHEYTYAVPCKYQQEYKEAQNYARENSLGLWGDICLPAAPPVGEYGGRECVIKGNINLEGEKIYHTPDCEYYRQTVINESAGERWFCAEQEALDAGWRKALNCSN
jgi:micrococcal nuclease